MHIVLRMDHWGLKIYKVYINDDHGLTLNYCKARSNLVKIAYCAYSMSRYQVSVYRIIGPLVSSSTYYRLKKLPRGKCMFGMIID